MKKYTVLLLRPDYIAKDYGTDTFLAHVRATTAATAVEHAAAEAAASDANEDRWLDYHPLITLEGWRNDVTPEAFR
jgi:hypothetical protein